MNKIIIELEVKNIRVFYEEELELPTINPANPFTVMESKQFSFGGFAWRLVISPNGYDDNTRGDILVRLQVMIELLASNFIFFKCATSKQMARCKTRFYLNDIHSSEIFENIFPGLLKSSNFSVGSKSTDVSAMIWFYLSKRNIRNILCSTL